jgi:hypothetical protein
MSKNRLVFILNSRFTRNRADVEAFTKTQTETFPCTHCSDTYDRSILAGPIRARYVLRPVNCFRSSAVIADCVANALAKSQRDVEEYLWARRLVHYIE